MRRRKFTLLLGGAIALTASPSKAQKSVKVPRIAFLTPLIEVQRPGELEQAFATITGERADGVFLVGGTMFFASRTLLAEQALKSRVPMMCVQREQVEAGCFMSYGASLADVFRRAAALVDRILRGTAPAELPVQQPTKFELVINAATARSLGIALPPSLLASADEVIE